MMMQTMENANFDSYASGLLSAPARAAALKEAEGLINPASGVANDYLNRYNEVLLLIENLPVLLPEMVDELVSWKPQTYEDYFKNSPFAGREAVLVIYKSLNQNFRTRFESCLAKIDTLALESVAVIEAMHKERGTINPEDIEAYCLKASAEIRSAIEAAMHLINHGLQASVETPQNMADRILSVPQLFSSTAS